MYKIEYLKEPKEKDTTYDDAFYSTLNNNNRKWDNYYSWLKEKYDMCYNIESITIDNEDIEMMKYDCFSNGVLLKLYLMCKKNHVLDKSDQVIIPNEGMFAEELIYNILKSDWLIDEKLVNPMADDVKRRKNYFEAMVEASEDVQDIKIQFRNKLYSYFIGTYDKIKDNELTRSTEKVLKLENKEFK